MQKLGVSWRAPFFASARFTPLRGAKKTLIETRTSGPLPTAIGPRRVATRTDKMVAPSMTCPFTEGTTPLPTKQSPPPNHLAISPAHASFRSRRLSESNPTATILEEGPEPAPVFGILDAQRWSPFFLNFLFQIFVIFCAIFWSFFGPFFGPFFGSLFMVRAMARAGSLSKFMVRAMVRAHGARHGARPWRAPRA